MTVLQCRGNHFSRTLLKLLHVYLLAMFQPQPHTYGSQQAHRKNSFSVPGEGYLLTSFGDSEAVIDPILLQLLLSSAVQRPFSTRLVVASDVRRLGATATEVVKRGRLKAERSASAAMNGFKTSRCG